MPIANEKQKDRLKRVVVEWDSNVKEECERRESERNKSELNRDRERKNDRR
jgi:hypothetical protein